MNKLTSFILILFLGPIIGAVYGVIHDQITFTISPEYYTTFKFAQFGCGGKIDEAGNIYYPENRGSVAYVGIMATWWVGLIIGIVIAFVSLIHKTGKAMFKIAMKAIRLNLIIAFVVGLIGLIYGLFSYEPVTSPWVPQNFLEYQRNFHIVGVMHNFSYLGGVIGLIVAIIYTVKKR